MAKVKTDNGVGTTMCMISVLLSCINCPDCSTVVLPVVYLRADSFTLSIMSGLSQDGRTSMEETRNKNTKHRQQA